MPKDEYRAPRVMQPMGTDPGWTEKVGLLNGNPDHRGNPTVRVVCEGRHDKGTHHKETVVATFYALPFDAAGGECGNWIWDSDASVGGGKRHHGTRMRGQKARRKTTEAEKDAGYRWDHIEVDPKVYVGMTGTGNTLHLYCPRCPLDLHLKEGALQECLDEFVAAEGRLQGDMAELQKAAGRKLPLVGLIARQTKPKTRRDARS
ncbi:MAG: hypothetical protein JWM64_2069 [Frankiales bacterium]|nr:hypothetical protein [Frankiales bacterium]